MGGSLTSSRPAPAPSSRQRPVRAPALQQCAAPHERVRRASAVAGARSLRTLVSGARRRDKANGDSDTATVAQARLTGRRGHCATRLPSAPRWRRWRAAARAAAAAAGRGLERSDDGVARKAPASRASSGRGSWEGPPGRERARAPGALVARGRRRSLAESRLAPPPRHCQEPNCGGAGRAPTPPGPPHRPRAGRVSAPRAPRGERASQRGRGRGRRAPGRERGGRTRTVVFERFVPRARARRSGLADARRVRRRPLRTSADGFGTGPGPVQQCCQ